jgi:hypothetical protein
MHGGLSPDLKAMEQIRRVVRPTDVPDTGNPSPLNTLLTHKKDFYAISCGPIPTKTLLAGERTIEEFLSLLEAMLSQTF